MGFSIVVCKNVGSLGGVKNDAIGVGEGECLGVFVGLPGVIVGVVVVGP